MKFKLLPLFALFVIFPTYASVVINEIMVRNVSFKVDDKFNFSGWVELYNSGAEVVDLSRCFFSNDLENQYLWQNQSNVEIQPGSYAIFYFDELNSANHASFKLDSDGGTLCLSDGNGNILDIVDYPKPYRNSSYGRVRDGEDSFTFFQTPSFQTSNNLSQIADKQTSMPQFSVKGGFFSSPQTVTITVDNPSAKIYYTTNGSEPKPTSGTLYNSPITLSTTTPLRAIAVVDGEVSSDVNTATYFIGMSNIPTSVKVVSLVTDRDYVYGDELGALVVGRNGSTVPSNCGSMDRIANYMNDWDRPCNFEVYDENKSAMVNQEVKISAFGACSRTKSIKSVAVKANKISGNNKFDCNLFREKPALKWKGLVLRNSGNDFGRMLFRDGYIQTVAASGMEIDHQAYEPTVVFMNGEYYAMLGMRERTNKDFVYSNYGLKEEDICINVTSKTGSTECEDFQLVKNIANNANSSDAFSRIDELIDVDEFLNYIMTEIYIFNKDWSDNNNKAWKRNEDGKWRWILFDTEYSTSLYEENMTNDGFSNLSNLPYLSQLIKNPEMSRRLMTKFVAHAGTTFDEVNTATILDSMMNMLSQEADYFRNFLAQKNIKETSLSWQEEAMKVRNFLVARQNVVFNHVANNLNYGTPVPLRIYSNIPGASYTLNGLEPINKSDFHSKYFTGSQISVKANAPVGYKFQKWEICRENYLINTNDSWKYLYLSDSVATPYNWKELSFDDTQWQSGEAPLGSSISYYVKTNVSGSSSSSWPGMGGIGGGGIGGGIGGGGIGGGIVFPGFGSSAAKTTFLRKEININNLNSYSNELQCLAHISDGAIIYLNGKEIYRYNLQDYVNDTTRAIYEMDSYATLRFNIRRSDFVEGRNVIAVELHSAKNSSSIAFDLSLLDENTGVTVTNTYNKDEYSGNVNEAFVIRAIFESDNSSTSYDKLYINEVCAANKQYVDEFRQDEDWIEIYNDGNVPVDLGGLYLSDKRKELDRFQIPTGYPSLTTVPAKGYLIFWADADSSSQGPLHTNFEIAKDKGQTISLSRKVNGQMMVIDSIRYLPHTNGQSYSRFSYTGNGSWVISSCPTFAKKNAYYPVEYVYTAIEETKNNNNGNSIQLYPNPATDYVWFSFAKEGKHIVTLSDLSGRIILSRSVENGSSLYVGNLPKDIYILNVTLNGDVVYKNKLIVE